MVHAPGQLADFRMQGAPEGNSHLLDTAAETKDGDALRNAGLRHLQRHFIPVLVVRFVARMGFGVKIDRMNVGAVARKQDAVDRVQQRPDIREVGRAREYQRQGIGDIRHSAKVFLPDQLRGATTIGEISGCYYSDHWFWHRLIRASRASFALAFNSPASMRPQAVRTV